mgnify:CR=1 FL=1|tara:strand:+ start:1835 stop:2437 length:603 start_codon:yes stop_codon:yes gene_type:complete
MQDTHLVLHGLAIKKHANAEAVSSVIDVPLERVQTLLDDAVARGRAVHAKGGYMLSPTARMALDGEYSRYYDALRNNDAFSAAYEAFEKINVELKTLITDWQTMSIGGQRVPNDHSDKAYDASVVDRLGELHERADSILSRLCKGLPRLHTYQDKLLAALEKAEAGETQWVSDARSESYHTVWFELHEELLRLMGRERSE